MPSRRKARRGARYHRRLPRWPLRVEHVRIVPVARGGARLEARVRYADRPRRAEVVWIEVPAALADGLDGATGNAFLAAFLPVAVALDEPLELDAPVDAPLLAGAAEIPGVWHRWYGTPPAVVVRAPSRPRPVAGPTRRVAFFSGGVDSTYTALHVGGPLDGARAPLDELLFVEGFDVRLRDRTALAIATRDVAASAAALGRPLHVVRTNLRDTRWHEADWALLAHGALLAAVALALGGRYGEAWIAASVAGGPDAPWGSHPATDERLSSWTLAVRQDGFDIERIDKLRAIAGVPGALARLRVCWAGRTGLNCGQCVKCVETRAMIDALVGPDAAPTLPRASDFLARLRAHPLEGGHDARNLEAIVDEARAHGRTELADAAAHARAAVEVVADRVGVRVPRSRRPAWRPTWWPTWWRRIFGAP